MTYWMEVAQWLVIGGVAGVLLGEIVGRPLVAASRRRRRRPAP